jgi:hypothetical protein
MQLVTILSGQITVMSWSQLASLPQASLAVQCLVICFIVEQSPATTVSLELITGFGSQLSVAVALPVSAMFVDAPQARIFAGGQVITGLLVSLTVMVWLAVVLLPQASVAVQVRVTL